MWSLRGLLAADYMRECGACQGSICQRFEAAGATEAE
jgi:hypothetical protein